MLDVALTAAACAFALVLWHCSLIAAVVFIVISGLGVSLPYLLVREGKAMIKQKELELLKLRVANLERILKPVLAADEKSRNGSTAAVPSSTEARPTT